MCMRLWRGYLCSDKTVNQINLAWKSLSAGPLCVWKCVCECVCERERERAMLFSISASPSSEPLVVSFLECVCVCVCVKEIYRECYISEWVCRVQHWIMWSRLHVTQRDNSLCIWVCLCVCVCVKHGMTTVSLHTTVERMDYSALWLETPTHTHTLTRACTQLHMPPICTILYSNSYRERNTGRSSKIKTSTILRLQTCECRSLMPWFFSFFTHNFGSFDIQQGLKNVHSIIRNRIFQNHYFSLCSADICRVKISKSVMSRK